MRDADLVHLYNRFGFGISPAELDRLRGQDRARVVAQLVVKTPAPPRLARARAAGETDGERVQELRAAWVARMAEGLSTALRERMALFWHGYFACMARTPEDVRDYLAKLYRHGLGNFGDLLHAMVEDRALLRYLNAQAILAANPNENFAREVMELFSLGPEAFDEHDVRNLARAFAGWTVYTADNRFAIRERQSDRGVKRLLGRSGTFAHHEAVDILLGDPACARFVTRRLWTYLTDAPPTEAQLSRHAAAFRESGLEILALVRSIALDDEFYAPALRMSRVKSPLDLVVQWHRNLGVEVASPWGAVAFARHMGCLLFAPPSVAGWPQGREWLTTATVPARLAMARISVEGAPANYRPDPTFESLAGSLLSSRASRRASREDSLVLLGTPDGERADVLALAGHSRYQYG